MEQSPGLCSGALPIPKFRAPDRRETEETRMKKKYKDAVAGSVLFVLALIYFIMSFSIKLTYIDRVVGSRLFPQICGVIVMALGAVLVISGLRQAKTLPDESSGAPHEKAEGIGPGMKTFLVLLSFAVFAYLLDKIGFTLAAFLYLFSQMLLMASKKPTVKTVLFYLVLSAALAAGIYLLFYKGFSLMLPKASWF